MSFVNENIKVLRNRMGLTQEKLAELIGVSRKVIGSYEEGRAVPPLENLNKFANIFEISIDDLTFHPFVEDPTPLFRNEEVSTPASHLKTKIRKPSEQLIRSENLPEFSLNTIPYVSYKYFDKYILEKDFERKLNSFPVFTLPFPVIDGVIRAFDIPADSDIEEGIVIVKKTEEISGLNSDKYYLLVTLSNGVILKKIRVSENQVEIEVHDLQGVEIISISDIKEIWEVVGYYSSSLPKIQPDLSSLNKKVSALKAELDRFL